MAGACGNKWRLCGFGDRKRELESRRSRDFARISSDYRHQVRPGQGLGQSKPYRRPTSSIDVLFCRWGKTSASVKSEVRWFQSLESSPFDDLPEDCVAYIISLTTPRNACVASSVSKTFRSTTESNSVWEKFLPKPCSYSWVASFHVEEGALFHFVQQPCSNRKWTKEKASGKRCIMLSARQLAITWGNSPQYWQWISIPEARFKEVPELVTGCPFKINGALKAKILSPDTRYSAYVIYKAKDQIPDVQKSFGVGLIEHETPEGKKWERQYLTKLEKRRDGWMEVKFGEFLNHRGFMDDRYKIGFYINEIKYSYWTPGFIIQGIEFRPVKKLW
ncbi:hypothetical protein Bca101_064212 [Brassica carinata]